MDRKLYLAYGSNLNITQMAQRCPTAKVYGTGLLKGFRLLFRGQHKGGVATVEPFPGGSVPVLAWEITDLDERALDNYEGYPYLYRKEQVEIELEGKPIEAMIYVMTGRRPLAQPAIYYYSIIRDGYKEAGFDLEILRKATGDSIEE